MFLFHFFWFTRTREIVYWLPTVNQSIKTHTRKDELGQYPFLLTKVYFLNQDQTVYCLLCQLNDLPDWLSPSHKTSPLEKPTYKRQSRLRQDNMPTSIWLKDVQFSLEEIHILNNQNAANSRRHRSSSVPLRICTRWDSEEVYDSLSECSCSRAFDNFRDTGGRKIPSKLIKQII